ncbi:MAG: futalosine hydrolase [Sphingobacteriales bacterium]|nr:futalosine hydrolase [Sphingobacteriales bacterium]MBI3718842.1 futalosine hydrolase [Sphingobacteriales bacterium]
MQNAIGSLFLMMNCLLIASTAAEITPFVNHYRNTEKLNYIDFKLDVLITGVGLTAATYALSKQVNISIPQLVIQAGVAGCFDKSIELGSVFSIQKDIIADQVVFEQSAYKNLFDLKLANANELPYTKGWLVNTNKTLLKRSKLKQVAGISVNEITTGKKKVDYYRKTFDPLVESMEGAALHYVCLMEDIPFLQIRSVCNYIGERNKKKWLLKDSIVNLNKELIRLLEGL